MKLIVGLGNFGDEYNNTRHNVGFMAIEKTIHKYNLKIENKKFDAIYTDTKINGERVIFIKPQKYMNLSGEVVKKYVDYYKIDIEDILIISDDMDIELGKYKLKQKGSSGGHNGLKNIEQNLKSIEYKRLKIGISKPQRENTINYVLGKFTPNEIIKLNEILEIVPNICSDFVTMSFDKLMNKYNTH